MLNLNFVDLFNLQVWHIIFQIREILRRFIRSLSSQSPVLEDVCHEVLVNLELLLPEPCIKFFIRLVRTEIIFRESLLRVSALVPWLLNQINLNYIDEERHVEVVELLKFFFNEEFSSWALVVTPNLVERVKNYGIILVIVYCRISQFQSSHYACCCYDREEF